MSKKQIWWLGSLLGFFILVKLPYLINQDFAFDYDHGRDALAVLEMIRLKPLRFIGPWTSIPGLFFGPFYYYLLVPLALALSGHPMSQTLSMFLLVLVQIYLAFRYFGFWEALIVATAPAWGTLALGSSNAFPMTLVMWLILIALKSLMNREKVNHWQLFWLGVFLSLGFHFSSALAIFLVPAVVIILLKNKFQLTTQKIAYLIFGFIVPFIPQILFEVKNQFLEVEGVVEYLKHGEKHKLTLSKFKYMVSQVGHELSLASLPELGRLYLGQVFIIVGVFWMVIKRLKFKYWFEWLILLVIPLIGFSGLHYNPWYVYGLFPLAVLVVSQVIKNLPKALQVVFLLLLLLTPLWGLKNYYQKGQSNYNQGRVFYKNKVRAIDYVYKQAGDKLFSVFVYTPEIYDYPWQYLFFWQGLSGKPLPVEFSYKPGETSYVKEKPGLLKLFSQPKESAEKTFLVINLPENKFHYPLAEWLKMFEYQDLDKHSITSEIEVWEVR